MYILKECINLKITLNRRLLNHYLKICYSYQMRKLIMSVYKLEEEIILNVLVYLIFHQQTGI